MIAVIRFFKSSRFKNRSFVIENQSDPENPLSIWPILSDNMARTTVNAAGIRKTDAAQNVSNFGCLCVSTQPELANKTQNLLAGKDVRVLFLSTRSEYESQKVTATLSCSDRVIS